MNRIAAVVAGLSLAFVGSSATSADATFEFRFNQAIGNCEFSNGVALGDLDNDGDLDAWIANGGFTPGPNMVWFNDGNGQFTDSNQSLGSAVSYSVALGDLDADGDLDAWVANQGMTGSPNTVWINNGNGYFSDSGQLLGNLISLSVALGDIDGDQDLDAWVANYNANRTVSDNPNQVWLNNGNGNFTNSGQDLGDSASWGVSLGDLDNDNDLDAFVANWNYQANRVWINDGNGIFNDSGQALGNRDSYSVALGDIDNDDDLDAWVTNYPPNLPGEPNIIWLNDGEGNFSDSEQPIGLGQHEYVALGDLDNDGDLDAVVTNYNASSIAWVNDGAGQFSVGQLLGGDTDSTNVALGDLNGDGAIDVWMNNYATPNIVWMNSITQNGVCCASQGCTIMNQDISNLCDDLGGIWLASGSCDDCPASCSGDTNNDGVIDIEDLLNMLSNFGSTCP